MKQWKRLAALSSAIVMAAATLTYFPNDTLQNIRLEISASAETTTEPQVWNEDNLTWTLDADGTLTISGTGAMKDYNSYDNRSPAHNNSNVKKVVIEDGVTSIGNQAFPFCQKLASVTIPDSVTSIENYAFSNCSSLTDIVIPNSVTSIGNSVFERCSNLSNITLSNNITSIGNSMFERCSNLSNITLSNNITSIGSGAFTDCRSLTSITIPDKVTSIEYAAFDGCSKLTSITIPDSITSIGDFAFRYCKSLPSITIPDSVTSIGNSAFFDCSSLTSITIPDSVTSIGNSAFRYCKSLTNITIPDSVTSIGNSAFRYCKNLPSITIPDSVTSIGTEVFQECTSLQTISLSCKSTLKKSDFGEQADLVSYTNQHALTKTAAKTATCSESGNKEYWTCEHCGKYFLSDDANPATATAVEQSETVISASHKLTKVEAKAATCSESGNKKYWTCEHCKQYFLSDDTNPETAKAVELSETVIPASHKLTKVEAKAVTCAEDGNKEYWTCEHCGKYFLSDDANPETAKAVEQSEFIIPASHKLTKVEAKAPTCTEDGNKEYWTCEHCGKYFLSDDTNPKTAKAVEQAETVIPALKHKNATTRGAVEPNGTKPGYSGDRYCPDCDTVFEKGYTYWNEDNLTWKLDADGTLTISGTGTMKDYDYSNNPSPANQKKGSVKKVVIKDGVTSIGNFAFYNCKSLTSITIPDSVTSIELAAFDNCNNLTSITIPDSVTSIGDSAFELCNKLSSITLSNNITSIGNWAFHGCPLTSITIPDSVTSIGDNAFYACSSLKTISLSCGSVLKRSDFGGQANLVSYTNQHLLTKTAAKAATCSESGNKEYWTCEHCGKYFLSDDANPETATAVELSETVIPASHKLTKVEAKDATCAENGNKEYWTCEHCGKYFLSDDTNPETAKAVELSETITPALKHKNATTRGAVKPTETEPGYSGDRYCSDCDTVLKKGYTYWNEGNLTWKLDADGTLTISGTGAMKDYDHYDNLSPAYNNSKVKKIVIEEGVTSIGNSAFENCSSLTDITIPDSVTSIGNYAFSGCSSLTDITLPSSVTSIKSCAFYKCSQLASIEIPSSVTSIGNSAFRNCTGLTSITIPESVTSIGDSAFRNCTGLTSITISDSVTSIGAMAFDSCSSLQTISLSCKSSLKKSNFGEQANLVSYTLHTLKKTEAKTVTCSEDGNKEYWTCEHCKKYFLSDDANPETAKAVEQSETVIPASHELTKVDAKAATCTEDGNIEYWTCEHCKKYFLSDDTNPETAKAVEQSETVIPASHKLTKVEAKAATCTEDGNKEYWTCEHCKKYFLSDDTNPATAKAVEQSETILPASHKLTKVKEEKAATCTESGNKAYWTCEHCKKYFLSDDTNPETATAVELSETVIPALVQIATVTTPIKCVYGQDMNKIDLRDYVKNTDVVGEVTVKVAAGSTLPDGMKLDNGKISGKPAKAYEDSKEVTFTFTAENGSTANLTLLFLVAKADPTVEVSVSGDSHTEGDLVSELKLILSENSTKGVVELVSEIKALVAGKNTFTWKFTPEDENNYHTVTGTVVVNAQTTTTTTTKATTTTKPNKTTTTNATTTTKPSKTTITNATTTTKSSKTTTTKATTTTKPSKTTTINVTTTTKPSKTTTTNATTTTKPNKTTTTNATTTTKPNKTTTTKATTTTKPNKTTTTKVTTTTKPSKTTTTKATTTTKPSKTTTTKATTTTKPSKTTTTNATTTTKPSKTTTTKATTTTKPSKTTTTKATTTKVTTTTKPSKTTTTKATTTTKPSKTTTTKATTTNTAIPSYGDVNLDGKVDIADAIFLNKYLATLIQFSDAQMANADCCQDGVLNDQDTTALMQFIILLIDDLPVQPTEK